MGNLKPRPSNPDLLIISVRCSHSGESSTRGWLLRPQASYHGNRSTRQDKPNTGSLLNDTVTLCLLPRYGGTYHLGCLPHANIHKRLSSEVHRSERESTTGKRTSCRRELPGVRLQKLRQSVAGEDLDRERTKRAPGNENMVRIGLVG